MLINMLLNQNISLLDTSFRPLICVPRLRHQLHFDLKREYFRLKLKKLRHSAARAHGPLRLNIRRDRVFEDSLAFFEKLRTGDEVRRKLAINFQGEEGMDAGGLTREWYTVLAREMFNPNYALFTATADGVTFQPNVNSSVHTHHLIYFKFVGRVIGKAICDGQLLDAHFTRSFYKHILGLPVNYHDLEAIEPDYFKSLKQLLELPLECLGLDLTFSTEQDDFGRMVVKPLIENGEEIPVTDDNKALYVQLVAHSRMTTAIEKQVQYTAINTTTSNI
jgi:E3 ubiquitin-protein ligase HUWE1